jgi:hypothetical protein
MFKTFEIFTNVLISHSSYKLLSSNGETVPIFCVVNT